jgi:hypothetical protein
MKVISKRILPRSEHRKVYDLSMKDNHNYVITKSDIIVHNSGKGFVTSRLLGIEGQTFDVDALKSLVLRAPGIKKKIHDELGIDLANFDRSHLKDPDTVSKLHDIVSVGLNLDKKEKSAFFASVLAGDPERKPNIIFDVTLSYLQKFDNLIRNVKELGYDPKNVHIVWVVNDVEVALKQNAVRDRVVKPEILINTHKGASQTMADIVNMGNDLKKYMDGAIVFAFNKVGVDSELVKSGKGGSYLKDANYFFIKKPGAPVISIDKIADDIRNKIREYVPKNLEW